VKIENDCRNFLKSGRYAVYLAQAAGAQCAGFATLCESHALYAGGSFGIIQEFYVEPQFRSAGLGRRLLDALWRMADAWLETAGNVHAAAA